RAALSLRGSSEELLQASPSILENFPDVALDEQRLDQRAADRRIVDAVLGQRPAALAAEAVLVPPQAIGPAHLLVDEAVGRLPSRDPRAPAYRRPVDPQLVVDLRPDSHLDRPI